jgi:hypothetical protein
MFGAFRTAILTLVLTKPKLILRFAEPWRCTQKRKTRTKPSSLGQGGFSSKFGCAGQKLASPRFLGCTVMSISFAQRERVNRFAYFLVRSGSYRE